MNTLDSCNNFVKSLPGAIVFPETTKGMVGKADDFCVIWIQEYRRWFLFLSFVMLFCKGLSSGLGITFALSPRWHDEPKKLILFESWQQYLMKTPDSTVRNEKVKRDW